MMGRKIIPLMPIPLSYLVRIMRLDVESSNVKIPT